MALDAVLSAEINDKASQNAEQDQTVRMYWLILLYTLLTINSGS